MLIRITDITSMFISLRKEQSFHMSYFRFVMKHVQNCGHVLQFLMLMLLGIIIIIIIIIINVRKSKL
jgi:hypothetical protein